MRERYMLPESNRSSDFYAEFVVKDEGDHLVTSEEWINAPHRGNEIMSVIQEKLQDIANESRLKVIHRIEAATLKGKKLIQRHDGYVWKDRSFEGYSIYEKVFLPN